VAPRLVSTTTVLAFALALAPPIAAVALYEATRIAPSDVMRSSVETATRRTFLVPHDPTARFALAYADAHDGHVDRARTGLRAARYVGARHADLLTLESEIDAVAGDCEKARASFRRSLEIRAEEHLARVLAERLPLGEYTLPPALVARCGLGDTP
jgi:hypothetical protein